MANDVLLSLIIKAVDLATADLEGVNAKVKELGQLITQSSFTTASDDMKAFGDQVKNLTDPLAQATAKTLALNTAIVGLASIFAGRVYDSAKSYESALADLAKVLDGGIESARQYGTRLNETASQFAQNGEILVGSMANFVQAGFNAEEAFNLVTESTKLMIAGDIEAARASELLVSILKGFQAPATDAGRAVDLLNEVSNKYATNVNELAAGMADLSPIARQMGFSFEETAGLLTPVIEVYRSGSEAADALKTGLQRLTDASRPVKTALASIGVSQTDVNGKLRDGRDIFFDVAKAYIGLTEAQKAYITQELVGIDQAGRMGVVFTNLAKTLEITAVATGATGSAMSEVDTRLQTAEAAGKRADESFRQLAVSLGNAFKPQIQGLVTATGELAAAFDSAIKAGDLAPLLNVLKPQIAAVENLVRAMADNLEEALAGVDWRPLVAGLREVSGELGEAFGKLTEGMDLTTVEGLRTLLQSIINILGNFAQFVAGAVDGLQPLLGALNTLFSAISQNSPALANLAGQISGLVTSINQIVPVVSAFGSAVFGAIGNVAELAIKIGLLVAAMKLLSAAGIPVVAILGRLVGAFLALNPAVATAAAALAGFPGVVTALVAGVGALGYGLGTLINQFVEWATGGLSVGSMLADLVDAVSGVNKEIERGATAEELAIARARRLAREKEAQAAATEAAAKAEEEARRKSQASAAAQEEKLKLAAAEEETYRRLEAQYAAMGLIYDRATGQILRQGEATLRQKQEARELGTALDKLGVDAGVMADRITAAGEETITTFTAITKNAQVTAAQVEAAFREAISKASTEAEVRAILKAYEEWAAGAKRSAADVAEATRIAALRNGELKLSVDEVNDAYKVLGITSLATLRQQADAAQLAYETIRDSGTASAAELIKAYEAAQAAAERVRNAQSILRDTNQQSTQQIKQNTTAIQENSAAQAVNVKHTSDTGAAVAGLAQIMANARAETDNLSAAARSFFEVQVTGTAAALGMVESTTAASDAWVAFYRGLEGGNQALAEYEKNLLQSRQAVRQFEEELLFASNGIDRLETAILVAKERTKAAFFEQAAQAERLADSLNAMAESGVIGLGALAQAEQAVNGGFELLDRQDLSNLQAAIDAVNDKIRETNELTQDARQRLAELDAELLEAKGQDKQAELLRQQIQYEQDLAELERLRQEAQAAGNTELIRLYDQQLSKLNELNRVKLSNIENDERTSDSTARTRQNVSQLADEAERAGRALSGLSTVNLAGLVGQSSSLTNNFTQLNQVL